MKTNSTATRDPGSLHPAGSASDYNPAQCLRAEVERFKATNRFTPMDVTGFYIQAAVVLDEHRRMVEALREIRETRLLDDEFVALIKQWRAIRRRQQSARRITIGDTYEEAENFISAMDRIDSHACGLGI